MNDHPLTVKELERLLELSQHKGPWGSDASWRGSDAMQHSMKAEFKLLGRKVLKRLAEDLGLAKEFDLRWNAGGTAVSGEVTLIADRVYVQMNVFGDLGILVRPCKSRKDYAGGPNRFVPYEALRDWEGFVHAVRGAQRVEVPA